MASYRLPALLLAALAFTACDPDAGSGDGDAPLSDYDALMDGAPSNAELPFDIKADGPAPIVHTDLLDLQSPVRNQGARGTCSIFATAALMEHLYIAAGMEDPDFSEQYLQWSSKFEVGAFRNTSGSNATVNLQAINQFGIVQEADWPYEAEEWGAAQDPACGVEENKPTHCYTNGAPPESAKQAEKFFLPRSRFLNSRREAIIDHIRVNGTGVVVGLDFFYQSWNHRKSTLPRNLDNWDEGIVLYPNDEDVEASHEQRAGHAVLIVGWDLDKEFPRRDADGDIMRDADGNPVMEKGFYIFKNSWGTGGFGIDNPHGAGYGWLSMQYVEDHGSARVTDIPELDLPEPEEDDGGAGEGQTLSSSERIAIPDADQTGVRSVLEASAGASITDVTVEVDIGHTFRGDLVVTLEHAGVVARLHDKSGGSQDDLQLSLSLPDFDGLDPEGPWTLRVVDTAARDVGELRSWSLSIR